MNILPLCPRICLSVPNLLLVEVLPTSEIHILVSFEANSYVLRQVLRQLQQGLAKCYSVAFEKSGAVSDAKITPHTLNFVKKLVSTFGVGLENVSNVSTMFSSAASESLARRAQATAQDPVFQKMKGQFTTGENVGSSVPPLCSKRC